MNTASASSVTEYKARSSRAIPARDTGPVPFQFRRAGRVLDIEVPEGFVIAHVGFGRRLIELDGSETLAVILEREPYEATAGSFVVVGTRNDSDEPRDADLVIRMASEHGPEIENHSPFRFVDSGAAPPSKRNGASARRSPAPGPRGPMPREPMPREPMPARPVPPPAKPPGAKRPKRKPTPDVITVSGELVIEPSGIERSMVLFGAHAEALLSTLTRSAPLTRTHRSVIGRVLFLAQNDDVAQAGSNEVRVTLDAADADRLSEAVRLHQEFFLRDTDRIVTALRVALGHIAAERKSDEPKTVEPTSTALATVLRLAPDDGRAE